MHQERVIFETSPGWIVVCILAGIGYALLLYRTKHPWSELVNWILFALRGILAFFLAFLLLGPIVRQANNFLEKPLFAILYDNSGSIREGVDSISLKSLTEDVRNIGQSLTTKGYEVKTIDLDGKEIQSSIQYNEPLTNLQGALRAVADRYEGKRIEGVLLISDGIYNSGISPLYASYSFPVNTLGIGDTAQRVDIAIRNVAFNKIAYEGNQFPVRAEVIARGVANRQLSLTLSQGGKIIDRQVRPIGTDGLVNYDFTPLANEKGIQKYDLMVESLSEELNKRNNRSSIFVEVVEGKKKILMIASSPHPDIKAIRSVVEKNSNYEFLLHIPGVSEQPATILKDEKIDLVILHQAPDQRGKTKELFLRFAKTPVSLLIILGRQSDLQLIAAQGVPLKLDGLPREYDDVTPVVNPAFNNFIISSEAKSMVADYPPVSVPFGRVQIPLSATTLLFQRVGNLTTDKPLLSIESSTERKIGVLLGEGLWRWRLDEYRQTEKTDGFDEIVGKLIQYLSTSEERSKFRSSPIRQEFSEVEPIVFESQVYNDIFEPVFGNTINIELFDESGKQSRYTYVLSPGNTRYQIGGLKEGVYRYRSGTTINGKAEETRGQFVVVLKQAELQNLTADFDLLRKLSANTGGKFYSRSGMKNLINDLTLKEATGVIRTEEKYDSLINLNWIFWILLTMITVEWFMRKFYGSY
ncbi:MAG TPA: VWA domain-containing protein [Cyclobacteriaceae bacterium]|nr:VWA domain-containing protein [Cyclobacteriaceae bacterium]